MPVDEAETYFVGWGEPLNVEGHYVDSAQLVYDTPLFERVKSRLATWR